MPFYDLYMRNSHFYTAVTKDETKLYWWKIFCLQQDLQSSRKREIKKRKNSNDWKLKVTKFILEIEQAY